MYWKTVRCSKKFLINKWCFVLHVNRLWRYTGSRNVYFESNFVQYLLEITFFFLNIALIMINLAIIKSNWILLHCQIFVNGHMFNLPVMKLKHFHQTNSVHKWIKFHLLIDICLCKYSNHFYLAWHFVTNSV